MKPLDQADELRGYYKDAGVADAYMRKRTAQPLNGFLHRRQVDFLNETIRSRGLGRVLEIACGPGRLTTEVVGVALGAAVDFSPSMLQVARGRMPAGGRGWNFLRTDAFALPFGSGAFDAAYTLRFVRHFRPEDRRRLYAEIRRVLRPGGCFMLDALNRSVSLPHREKRGVDTYKIYDVLYTRAELEAELTEAGFRVARMEGILKRFALQQPLNRLRRLRLGGLARWMIAGLEMLPGDAPETWMLLCEKPPDADATA
jgi:ubiquinone/menaquinone biosynthesis C-methylase UbiE